ncbi:MAG: hypothetical protein JKX85_14495 [Phycisphaeraceae bacterium]|nr:hypothetical protein [Phycisphaeraceae bacterium]
MLESSKLFTPIQGHCMNTGISPKRLLKALLRGRLTPLEFSNHSKKSWQMHYADLPVHLLLRLKKPCSPNPSPPDIMPLSYPHPPLRKMVRDPFCD